MPEYCVTGGTGLVAAHLVKTLLQKGHKVRATVRDPGNLEKVGFLWEFEGAKERLKLMKADLLEDNSFDEAVHGVDGVFHVASPVIPPPYGDNFKEILVDPIMKGTVGVLKSCIKAGVQRVVLTSSSACLRCRNDVHKISPLNESHWSDIDYCIQYKLWYGYAKTLAEQEAWKISKESGLDLVVVIPCFIVGGLLTPQPTSTLQIILSIINGTRGEIPHQITGFVHVDDVVSGHILAMEEKKASGRLIMCSGPTVTMLDVVEMLKAKYPMYPYPNKVSSTSQQGVVNPYAFNTSKIIELGLPGFKTLPEMFDDCVRSFQDKGLL